MADIEIKPLYSLDEMRAAVELQKIYWGDNLESVVPAHMLFSLANHGGHVLAAFDGSRLVGMLVGFLGTDPDEGDRPAMANLQLVSKRMVVLPEYRNQGIGFRLKKVQRNTAIKQGVRLVTWTFDPLLAANAHLNIRKLGAVCQKYMEDYYGTSSEGGLATLGSSDRLLAEWWVTNRRVEERLHGKRGDLSLEQYLQADTTIINPTVYSDDGALLPSDVVNDPTGSLALLEIPINYQALVHENPSLAQSWRTHVRAAFRRVLTQGFVATDFLRDKHQGRDRAFYLLSYSGPQFETFTMN
jgi:predicted GNAT superfamily acetyltransferase